MLIAYQVEPLALQIQKVIQAGDSYRAPEIMGRLGDVKTIARGYSDVTRDLYRKHRDLPTFIVVSRQGIEYLLSRAAEAGETDRALALTNHSFAIQKKKSEVLQKSSGVIFASAPNDDFASICQSSCFGFEYCHDFCAFRNFTPANGVPSHSGSSGSGQLRAHNPGVWRRLVASDGRKFTVSARLNL